MSERKTMTLSIAHLPVALVALGLFLAAIFGFGTNPKAFIALVGILQVASVHWFWFRHDPDGFLRSYRDSPAILGISLLAGVAAALLMTLVLAVSPILALMVAIGCLTMPIAVLQSFKTDKA